MNRISKGDKAPDFTLPVVHPENDEAEFTLSNELAAPLVLFFYPKDDTPGCTKESIGFTDMGEDFAKLGVKVLGISPDPAKKHVKFRDKHGLKVGLIADEEQSALNAYGVWVEKSMYGKTYMGVERTTLLIDTLGTVVEAWHKVKVPGHVEAVLEAARKHFG